MSFKRIVFITRLSSIGDILIALQACPRLLNNGYYPIFVTSSLAKPMLKLLENNFTYIIFSEDQKFEYVVNQIQIDEPDFINYVQNISVKKPHLILDLQKTRRSQRVQKKLKQKFKFQGIYSVSKRTLYRVFLIFITFLYFNQNKRKRFLNFQKIRSIKNLQENSIDKIMQLDKNFDQSSDELDLKLKQQPINLIFSKDKIKTEFLSLHYQPPHGYVCIFPGASGFVKMWPKEKFKSLINLLLNQSDCHIVLCGSKQETFLGDFLDFPNNSRVFNFINKTNLAQTLSLIHNANYVVTNDSFPAHAAALFNTPATVIFGATSPKFGFISESNSMTFEYSNLKCSPCTRHGLKDCRYKNLRCLTSISSKKIFQNCSPYINNN